MGIKVTLQLNILGIAHSWHAEVQPISKILHYVKISPIVLEHDLKKHQDKQVQNNTTFVFSESMLDEFDLWRS